MKITEGISAGKKYICAAMRIFLIWICLMFGLPSLYGKVQPVDSSLNRAADSVFTPGAADIAKPVQPIPAKTEAAPRIIARPSRNRTNVFLISLTLLFIFAAFRINYYRHISQLFTFMTKSEGGNRTVKERLSSSEHISWLFVAVYLLGLGYILYDFIQFKGGSNLAGTGLHILPLSIAACLGYFFLKQMLQKWVAWTFMQTARLDEYRLSLSWVLEISAIVLFPLCIALVMSTGIVHQWILYMGLTFILVVTLFRYVRMMGILKNLVALNFIYFFLYICAFEILPAAALFKLLFSKVSS